MISYEINLLCDHKDCMNFLVWGPRARLNLKSAYVMARREGWGVIGKPPHRVHLCCPQHKAKPEEPQ
jgi:hypothetical protein